MKKIPVLIVAPKDDLHAKAVFSILSNRGIPVRWVDFSLLNKNHKMTLKLEDIADVHLVTIHDEKIKLSEVDTIWLRRSRPPTDYNYLDERLREYVRGEWEHFIHGIESFCSARWVNSPTANRLAGLKSLQLVTAKETGLDVPRTVITNDPQDVKDLVEEGVPLIYKHIGQLPYGSETKALLPSDFLRLDTLWNCPAIFQQRIDAELDIRVTAIGNNLYAVEVHSQTGQSPLDWRLDYSVPFYPHKLENQISEQLCSLMRRLNLLYGAIDLRLTRDNEYVFLEINPSGQYLFIEILTQMPLSEKMADFLTYNDK